LFRQKTVKDKKLFFGWLVISYFIQMVSKIHNNSKFTKEKDKKNNYHYYCRLKAPYARPLGLNLRMNSDDFAMFPTLWLSLVNLNTLAGKLQALESEHLHHIVHHSNRPNLEK
jgi:hypothetical protein